jgi:proteasome-associated ATPase
VVIFFDELESMFSRRGSGISSDMESTVVPQLLSEIDGLEELNDVIIIGASNRYDLIDPAVLRPGRLDLKIYIGRPNPKSAAAVFSKYLTPDLPLAPATLDEFGGSAEKATGGLISRAVDTIYSPNSYLQIYEKADQNDTMNRERRMPLQKRKAISDIINGAMLESMVTRAKRSAVRREIEQGRDGGLCWQLDLLQAIRSECEESKEQYISELRSSRDIAGTEAFAVDVHLDETAAGTSTKPETKWFKGKARAWAAAS